MTKLNSSFLVLGAMVASILFSGCDLDSESSDFQSLVDEASGTVSSAGETVSAATEGVTEGVAESASSAVSSGGGNDIDVGSVIFLDADVSGWAQTANLNASVSGGSIVLDYDQANSWPSASVRAKDGSSLNANPWVVVNVNGQWYAATFEWLKTGQTAKPTSVVTGRGGHIVQAPLNTFNPVSGQQYGFMVTTPARGGSRTINERSNISVVTWP
ncbi:hypothetical protein P3T73_06000 [Kiritimatiellota bacterium B12222]|nr:hypothetical protein P3T73_06000 [Kiritimatiellota bacterium B12222]